MLVERTEYPTDINKKNNAILLANYNCEINPNHESFIDKNGKKYSEGHHLIPLKYSEHFNHSLDVESLKNVNKRIYNLCKDFEQ